MDILEKLLCEDEWRRFLDYKIEKGHLTRADENELANFIEAKEYLPVAERIQSGGFFSLPEAVKINKSFSDKKRTVFIFPKEENYVQKFLAFELLEYDGIFCDNLYSFRRNMGVKKAITDILGVRNLDSKYSFKLDISDYFNCVDSELFLPILKDALKDEPRLYALFEEMITNPSALIMGETAQLQKGILAGSPVSGFFANLFISQLDRHFEKLGVPYARYSDDIIFFADSEEELGEHIDYTLAFLDSHGLSVNPKKVFSSKPGEKWTFLGFSFEDGVIDISETSKLKLKKKMRRKANALVRWKNRKSAEPERAVRAFIRYFNRKLYCNPVQNELTWARWYFPIINTEKSLREIDAYMQQCIRYIATEKRTKAQYNFSYENMKQLGYVTLVNKFYDFKNNG